MRSHPLIRLTLAALLIFALICNAQAAICSVGAASTAFGPYNPASSVNVDTTGSLRLTCSTNTIVTLSLGVGSGAGASYSTGRKMTRAGGGTLTYNFYTDVARTRVFGDGTNGSFTRLPAINGTVILSIYGRIPGSQSSALAGSYTDTPIITIAY